MTVMFLVLLGALLLVPVAQAATAPGVITGKVTAQANGAGLSGLQVTAYRQDASGAFRWAAGTSTRSDGTYRLGQLAAGSYVVGVTDPARVFATPSYYGGATAPWYAYWINVGSGVTGGMDIALYQGSHIRGVVTDAAGDPLKDVTVTVTASNDSSLSLGTATTGEDGSYDIAGLPGGWTWGIWGYFDVSFHDTSGAYCDTRSRELFVEAEATLSDVNAALQPAGSISGRILGAADGPSTSSVSANLFRYPDYGWWEFVASADPDDEGRYAFGSLAAGIYAVEFVDGAGGYHTEYYDDQWALEWSTRLELSEGQDLTGIDATLAPVKGPTGISGTVRDISGRPIAGVAITAQLHDWASYGATTDVSGAYRIEGIPNGEYVVKFSKEGYAATFYRDAFSWADVIPVTLEIGELRSDIDATLHPGGEISGRVSAWDGGEFRAGVAAYRIAENGEREYQNGGSCDETGAYVIGDLPPGDYVLEVSPYDWPIRYPSEWYEDAIDAESAKRLTLKEGGSVTGVDVVLDDLGSISGRLLKTDGTPATEYGSASLILVGGDEGDWWSANVDGAGRFTAKGLPEGDYRISFWAWDMTREYYDDVVDPDAATLVHVGRSEDVVLPDVTLEPAGHITGRVSLKTGESPEGVWVWAYQFNGETWYSENGGSCDANGAFDIGALNPGTYKLAYTDWDGRFQGEQYYGGDSLDTATSVTVDKSAIVPVDGVVLGTWSHIRGQVTDDKGSVLKEVRVSLYASDGSGGYQWMREITTDDEGRYDFNLAAGTYTLGFSDPYNRGLGEYYENADTLESAKPIVVGPDQVVSGIDAMLSGGHITGAVTGVVDGTTTPLAGVAVYAYSVDELPYAYPAGSATTGTFGFYDLGGLRTGEYVLAFEDPDGRGAPEYYDDVVRIDVMQATPIAVVKDETTQEVDAHLTGAHIAGHVQDETGAPVVGGLVTAYGAYGGNSAKTDENGDYDIGGLLPSDYVVEFYGAAVGQAEMYDNVDPAASGWATRIYLDRDGYPQQSVDATLEIESISGTVTDANGRPLDGIEVSLYLGWPWYPIRLVQVVTHDGGTFEIGNVQPGQYKLGFHDPEGQMTDAFWGSDVDDVWLAQGFDVPWHQSITDMDVQMQASRRVDGAVTDSATGAPLAGITVEAHRVERCCCGQVPPGPVTGTATTDENGHYELGIVKSPLDVDGYGYYILRFIDPNGDYLTEWQSDVFEQRDVAGAEQFWVEKGATLTVNGQMNRGGSISGTVTNPDGSPFTAGGRVYISQYPDYDPNWVPYTEIGSEGTYSMGGLIPGRYYVRFQPEPPYIGEWWNDWVAWPEEDNDYLWRIELGLSEAKEHVDAVLSQPRTITGHVKDGAGKPLEKVQVTAYRMEGGSWAAASSASTDATGLYQFPTGQWDEKLRDGVYRLEFSRTSFASEGGLVTRWWPAGGSIHEAQDISIVDKDISGVDMTMSETTPAMVASYSWSTQVAASSSWEDRPPDDSAAWIDVTRAPGVSVLASEGDTLYLQERLTLTNTGSAPLQFDDYYSGELSITLQPGETVYTRHPSNRVRVYAVDSFGREFNEEFTPVCHVRWLRPEVSVKKYVSSSGDPGGWWWDADTDSDALNVFTGEDLYFMYEVRNTGNCTLPEVTLTDDGVPIATKANLRRDDPDTWEVEGTWNYVDGPFTASSGLNQDMGGVTAVVTDTFGRTWTNASPGDAAWYDARDLMLGLKEEVATSPDGPWQDLTLSVPMGSKVYYRVGVSYDSVISLPDVPVTDLGSTPDDPSDDVVIGTIDIEPGADQVWTKVIGPFNAVYGTVDDTMSVTATWEQGEATASDGASYTSKYLAFGAAYWAVHPQHWGPTSFVPYSSTMATATKVGDIFKAASLYSSGGRKAKSLSNYTFMQSLTFSSGATLNGAAQRLLKAGAAAMLNAKYAESYADPRTTYPFPSGWSWAPYDTTTVMGRVNTALREAKSAGDASIMLRLAAELEGYNQGIAPW